MSRLRDWGIDALDELENQIEEALEEEYQRGRSEGYAEAADEDAETLEAMGSLSEVLEAADWNHNNYHDSRWPMRMCGHLLCRLLTQLDEEVR